MESQTTVKAPEVPAKLWMLWDVRGYWVRSIDTVPDKLFLICTSEADANVAAEYQNQEWECECIPVRVK